MPPKPEKKDPPPPTKKDPFVEIVFFFLVLFALVYLLNSLLSSISSSRFFSGNLKSFTPQGILLSHTRPIGSLSNPIGSKVVSSKETSVYKSPGEEKIGSQKAGARGKILQGPVVINGERYWYVDYDSGVDGWVKEKDIAYLESEPNFVERFFMGIFSYTWLIKTISIILSILFVFFIIFLAKRLIRLRANERALLYPATVLDSASVVNPKWERVISHIESLNENDWRLAIIEADIILDELLDKLSLHGDTIGEKLKTVEKSDFTTIDNAWEAHKIRNQIAHEGAEFLLTQREARRVVELYRTVFEEFQII